MMTAVRIVVQYERFKWGKTFSGEEQGCPKFEDQQNSFLKFYEYL